MEKNTHSNIISAIWPWREEGDRHSEKERARMKRRALIQSAVTMLIGIMMLLLRRVWMGRIVVTLSIIVCLSGLFFPRLFKRIEQGGKGLARVVGTGLTWILLVPFFYIVFFSGRLCVKLAKKDPLCRTFPSGAQSYWISRSPTRDSEY
jgi:hypothetical protein